MVIKSAIYEVNRKLQPLQILGCLTSKNMKNGGNMVRIFNNLELITLVYNKELQDGDMIFVMPSNIDLAKQALNTPYIYRNGSLSSDDTDESWVYEKDTYWTINEIHPWLEPYVNEVYK